MGMVQMSTHAYKIELRNIDFHKQTHYRGVKYRSHDSCRTRLADP